MPRVFSAGSSPEPMTSSQGCPSSSTSRSRPGSPSARHGAAAALFADALAGAPDLRERGVAYVRFAATHPAHFQVMFQPDLHRTDEPDLLAARARATEALREGVADLPRPAGGEDDRLAGMAAWSLAHGFATLLLSGALTDALEGRDPEEAFRSLAGLIFTAEGRGGG
ncbi:TetR-like C-terminal domain-containing protein [Streptomyces griseus]|uniref:TetR-like C-terminal domain-containing protein n=1 Tax=Streptomyces griseus TaxID=1911 RepID=UPI0037AA6BAE